MQKNKPLRLSQGLSRRELLKGMGLAAVTAATGSLASAQIAQADRIKYYSFMLGDATMTVISDNVFEFGPGFFGPEEDVLALINSQFPAEHGLRGSVQPILMQLGDRVVMIDTGTGAGNGHRTVATLEAMGISPEDVTDVVISHWHGDHVSGMVTDGAMTFPNAAVYFPALDLEFLQNGPEDAVGGSLAALQPALDAGVVTTYEEGTELVGGIVPIATPGHTPGHHCFRVTVGENSMLIFADAAVNAYVSPAHPEWAFNFDADAEQASESRRMILQMAAEERIPIASYHFTYPGTGYINETEEAFEFVPYAF